MSANPSRKLLRRRIRQDHPGALARKPVGVWGWRVAHGARTTSTTTAGGRAHTVHSFQQAKHLTLHRRRGVQPGRAYRRARIAAARKRL